MRYQKQWSTMAQSKEKKPEFRTLLGSENKLKPLKELYAGFEIEKRFLLLTPEEDTSKGKNGITIYNEVLEKGKNIKQGYIKDIQRAKEILDELGIALDFKPNTIRFRQYGSKRILTVKDRKETKKREVEWKLSKTQFNKYWPETKGARIYKKRLEKRIKGWLVEIDAFVDRFLLIAEIEVEKKKDLKKVPNLGMDITGNKKWTNKSLSW